jgi:hypothetical protein
MMCRAIDTDGGRAISRDLMAATSSSRLNQFASASSSWSTAMTWPAGASARKPSIRLRGIGQGWLPRYRTLCTLIPVSSATSRTTACSADSPGSTNPARIDTRRPGQAAFLASRQRSSGSVTSMMTAGSVRGKCSLPSFGHTVEWPPGAGTVGVPSCGQWVCESCQLASATAWVNNPASRSPSSDPASRSEIARTPASVGSSPFTPK